MGPTKKPRIRLPSFLKSRQYLPPRDRTSFCRATTAPLRRLTPLRAPHATHRKSSNGSEGIRFTSCTLASDESGGLPAASDEGSLGILRGRQQDRGHTYPRLASRNSRRARSRLVTSSPCEKPATRLSSDEKFGYSAAKISARPSPQGRVIRSFTHGPRFAKGFVDASGIVPLLLVPERCHRIDSASSPRRNPAASVATLNKSAGTPIKTGGWITPLVIARTEIAKARTHPIAAPQVITLKFSRIICRVTHPAGRASRKPISLIRLATA
jgi:hypothetical protein